MSFALEFTHDYNFTVYNATASWGCVDDCCSMIDTATSGAPHVQGYCGADLQTARLRTALVFVAIIPVLTILPLLACWLCNRGCRARGRSTSVAARTETTKSEAKLVAAEQAPARLHSRVQGFLFVIGWLL